MFAFCCYAKHKYKPGTISGSFDEGVLYETARKLSRQTHLDVKISQAKLNFTHKEVEPSVFVIPRVKSCNDERRK